MLGTSDAGISKTIVLYSIIKNKPLEANDLGQELAFKVQHFGIKKRKKTQQYLSFNSIL